LRPSRGRSAATRCAMADDVIRSQPPIGIGYVATSQDRMPAGG
jgi:hypothetical protein